MRPRLRFIALATVLTLLVLAGSSAALWESEFGSDPRAKHCDPIDSPQWHAPTLEFFDPWQENHTNNNIIGVWGLNGTDVPWLAANESVVVVRAEWNEHRIYDHFFNLLYRTETPHNERPMLVDVEQSGTPQLLFPPGFGSTADLVNLAGDLIRTYTPDPVVPGVVGLTGQAHGFPAIGDFTQDGDADLVFAGTHQWHAYSADGQMIARHVVVDPYEMGFRSNAGHHEAGRDHIYIITMKYPQYITDELPLATRLHKLTLEPMPADTPLTLPYHFNPLWTREFPDLVAEDQLYFYDLTGDGDDEIILAHSPRHSNETKAFTILDLNGKILYQYPANLGSKIAIGDLNGDGVNEVVALLNREARHDPDRYWEPWAAIAGVQWTREGFTEIYHIAADDEYGGTGIVTCDLNGDGADEVLIVLSEPSSLGHGKLKILKGDGSALWEYRLPYGMPQAARIDDINQDGNYEIIFGSTATQLFVFTLAPTGDPEQFQEPDEYRAYLLEHDLPPEAPPEETDPAEPAATGPITRQAPGGPLGFGLVLALLGTAALGWNRSRGDK